MRAPAQDGDDHPDRDLRHLGRQADSSDQPGTRLFERPASLVPQYSDVRYYTFPGGCATYRFVFAPGASPGLATAVDSAVAFTPRAALVGYVRRTEGLALCGRGPHARDDPVGHGPAGGGRAS